MKKSIVNFIIIATAMIFFASCTEENFTQEADNTFESEKTSHAIKKRNCGLHAYYTKLENDPALREAHQARVRNFEEYATNNTVNRSACSSPKQLPVAIHFQSVSNPNKSCLIGLAQSSITALNQDYQGTNSDISLWNNTASAQFPGISNGEACIEFVIANQNHPSGFGLSNGDPAVTFNQFSGENDSRWSGYINIIVKPNTGVLGYSPLGGSGNGDALVIDAGAFGIGGSCGSVGAQSPYNLGRTLTHEMGHYLNLDHIWGGGCNQDDGVSDTPDQGGENYDCPNLGITSCGSKDLFMNYMDYVNDACMYMFSAGQATRSENWVNANLANVTGNASNVIGGSTGGNTGGGTGGDTGGDTGSACDNPTSITATAITNTGATISWNAVADAIKYRIRYKKQGTSSWTTKSTTSTSQAITGLQSNSTYLYQLRTQCPSGWKPYTSSKTFATTGSTGGGNDGGGTSGTTEVKLRIKLDNYGSETSWELINNDNGNTVSTGGPYADGQGGTIKSKTWNLPNGFYTIYIDDSYGDGICCDYGNGFAKILNENNQIIAQSNGQFGYYDYLDFEVDNGVVTFKGERSDEKSALLAKKAILTGN